MNAQLKAMDLSFGAVQHTLSKNMLDGAFVLVHARHCQVNESIKIYINAFYYKYFEMNISKINVY